MFKQKYLWSLVIFSVLILLASGTFPVQATEFDEDGIIGAEEVINDDVFLNAETVTMDGTVNGILFAGGNLVTINGTVNGDLFAGGTNIVISPSAVISGNIFCGAQSVEIKGNVEGSIFCGSYVITIGEEATVERNLFIGAYHLELEPHSKVGQDLYAGAGGAILSGQVGRDINIGANGIELNGTVGGDVIAEVSSAEEAVSSDFMRFFLPPGVPQPQPVAAGLHVSEDAQITGRLEYTSPVEQTDIASEPNAGIIFQTPQPEEEEQPSVERPRIGAWSFLQWLGKVVRNFVTLMLLGALVLWLMPVPLRKTVDMAVTKPLPATGWGLVVLIVVYAGAVLAGILILAIGLILAVVTLGGLSKTIFAGGYSTLALIMTAFSLLVSYGSKLVVAFLAGEWVMKKLAPASKYLKVWALLIGVIIYVILRAIPIFGWVIGLLVTLLGIGAMWLYVRTLGGTTAVENEAAPAMPQVRG